MTRNQTSATQGGQSGTSAKFSLSFSIVAVLRHKKSSSLDKKCENKFWHSKDKDIILYVPEKFKFCNFENLHF